MEELVLEERGLGFEGSLSGRVLFFEIEPEFNSGRDAAYRLNVICIVALVKWHL